MSFGQRKIVRSGPPGRRIVTTMEKKLRLYFVDPVGSKIFVRSVRNDICEAPELDSQGFMRVKVGRGYSYDYAFVTFKEAKSFLRKWHANNLKWAQAGMAAALKVTRAVRK